LISPSFRNAGIANLSQFADLFSEDLVLPAKIWPAAEGRKGYRGVAGLVAKNLEIRLPTERNPADTGKTANIDQKNGLVRVLGSPGIG
jgi:hypothetical protein